MGYHGISFGPSAAQERMMNMDWRALLSPYQDRLVHSLQSCIRIPSVYADDGSGHPYGQPVHDCLQYMLKLSSDMGFATGSCDGHVGWCEYGEGEEMVAVLGHLDVVPAGEGWSVDPFGGDLKDGRVYGRGSMDDKGPTMAALYALLALKEAGLPLKRRIRILYGLNEETGSADMKYYLKHGGEVPVMGITPDGEYPVINGEKGLVTEYYDCRLSQSGPIRLKELSGGAAHNIVPDHAAAVLACTSALAAQIAAITAEQVTVSPVDGGVRIEAPGVNAHGGSPWEGENAVGRLLLFLDRLPLEGGLQKAVHALAAGIGMEWDGASLGIAMEDALSGKLTLNLGVVSFDGETLQARLNYRYPVTRTFEECGPQVEQAMARGGFVRSYQLHKSRIYMPPDSPLVRTLLRVYSDYTGQPAQPKCIGGGTYAKMIPNTLAFGPIFPGDEVREHKPDEYMEVSRLMDNAAILAHAMYELANG